MLGVAVVGLGVGEQHAHAFHQHPHCDLRLLFDWDQQKAQEVQTRVGAGQLAESYEAILADPRIDIIALASFDHLHYAQVVQAFEAGKHVFVEKPLCRTLDELRHIKQVWQQAGCPHLASNLVLRKAALYQWVQDHVQQGTFGTVYALDVDYLYGRLPKLTQGWRKDVPDYSVMEGGGVHMLDIAMMLSGQRPSRVRTVGNRICTEGTDFQYHDFMAATFECDSGLIMRATANFGCVHRHHHIVRLFGTKATVLLDDQGPRVHWLRDDHTGAAPIDKDMLPAGKGVLIPDFVAGIVSGQGAAAQAQREFDLISVIAASDQAHALSKTVEVEYI